MNNQRRMMGFGFGLWCLCFSSYVAAIPNIEHWLSDKNVPVYLISAMDLPMLDVQVLFDAGSVRDGEQAGLAMLTQNLSLHAAGGLSTDAVAEKLDSMGAILSGDVDMDMTTFSLRSLTQADLLQPALDLLLSALTQADFLPADFNRQQKRSLVGLEYQQQQPATLASRAFFQQLYGNHPYAQPTSGSLDSIAAIKLADVKAFYQHYYVANNAIIVMVGAVDVDAAKKIAQKIASQLPERQKAPAIAKVSDKNKAIRQHIEHPSSQTHILLGQLGYDRLDPDYLSLYIANHVFGGSDLVSRLSQQIREKRGLSYSVYSYFAPLKQTGYFLINLQTANKNVAEALKVTQDSLNALVEQGISATELAAAKQNLSGGFALKIDSNNKLAAYVAMIAFYHKPLDYLTTWTDNIEAVTLDQVNAALKRRLHPDRLVLLTAGATKVTQ